jgi:hypothetical protein
MHMHGEGFSVAEIVRATGLPEKDVNGILNK